MRAFQSIAYGIQESSFCSQILPSLFYLFLSLRDLCCFLGFSLVEVRSFSLWWPLLLQASEVAACGIFPDQGSNLCLLHWQVDSFLWSQQGSPFPSPLKMDNIFDVSPPCLPLFEDLTETPSWVLELGRSIYSWKGSDAAMQGELPKPEWLLSHLHGVWGHVPTQD